MIKKHKILLVVFVSICLLFILDKRFFNKELFILPYTIMVDAMQYRQDEDKMRKIVEQGIPGLRDKKLSDFERMNKIRIWVHEQSVWGRKMVDAKSRMTLNRNTALYMYNVFSSSRKAFDCGSYSVFLQKIYQLYGYDGFTYDMGRDGQFRHSVVLVWIRDNGTRKLIVQDPSYNVTYASPKGTPLDFFDLVTLIKNKKISQINIVPGKGIGHKTLCYPSDRCNLTEKKIIQKLDGGIVIFREEFDIKIIKDGLKSFLYCRYLRYFDNSKRIFPIVNVIDAISMKMKMSSVIEVKRIIP